METCGQTIDMEQMVDEFFNNSVIDHVVRWCYQEDPATRTLAKEAADCGAQLLPLLGEGMQTQYEDCNFARGLWESAQHQRLWFLGQNCSPGRHFRRARRHAAGGGNSPGRRCPAGL